MSLGAAKIKSNRCLNGVIGMKAKARRQKSNSTTGDPVLDMEAARAKYEGKYPERLIDKALRITHGRMNSTVQSQIQNPQAFFQAVLRRLVLNDKTAGSKKGHDERFAAARRELMERMVISSLIGDLKRAGYSRSEIYHKILESLSGKVSPELLENYRKMLVSDEEDITRKAS